MPRATASDLSSIRQLLAADGLPTSDLDDPSADVRFIVIRDGETVAGAVGVQLAGSKALLRSLVVAPERRGHGLGRRLVAEGERAALQAGVGELVLLTETAAPFFERLGYRPAVRSAMSPEILATAEFASLCPSTATCLSKPLSVTLYHNPNCGTSRNVLGILREASIEPDIVEYLRTPPDRPTLLALLQQLKMTPRELLREKGTPYAELGLDDLSLSDDTLIAHLLETPLLINRPIVVAPWGARLCRPSETVREFLLLE